MASIDLNGPSSGFAPVSIVVVNYNAGSLLLESVASALEQATEVVVIDNASSDNSITILEENFSSESRLRVIHSDTNLGFAAGCNLGFSATSEASILFLNPDCVLDNDSLLHMKTVLDAEPRVGMVGGLLLNTDGTEQGGGRRAIPTPWRSFVRAFGLKCFSERWPKLFFDFHLHEQPLPDEPIGVEAVSGACMLVKREAMEDVGLWDESYFLHCEDLDLCMRFRQKEWKILFVPDAPLIHYLGVCSRSRPIFVEWHKHKGMMKFYKKFFRHQYPGLVMWLVALGVWIRFVGVVLYYSGRHVGHWLGLRRE